MKLTFIGADHEVTGSCHFLEAAGKKILIDYGLEQGKDTYENVPLPVSASEIDYVFVTHAHIDHTGMLPLLGKNGFNGKIYATRATCDLCDIMLLDSAHIQEFEAEWRNRKGKRKGLDPYIPLYVTEDAEKILTHFIGCPYDAIMDVSEGIRIRFVDVGHLLGSSAIEVWVTEDDKETKIVFSGDVGNIDQPLIKDPKTIDSADYVLIESTYGDRSHGVVKPDYVKSLAEVIQKTFDRGGNVIIPSFAVGRTQEMLYFLRQIKEENLVTGHDEFPVYVDSPLAVKATGIFNENTMDCFDEEAMALINQGINAIAFPGLRLAETSDESRAINDDRMPKVILSASGMCEAGRIKHHLKHNLWREECTILFVGYQAESTLGRALVDGASEVTLFGETISVQAEILVLPGISGHADREGLLAWMAGFKEKPKKVFVVHGNDATVDVFGKLLNDELGLDTYGPYSGTVWDLTENVCLKETQGVPVETREGDGGQSAGGKKARTVYSHLEEAQRELQALVESSRGWANKDLKKLSAQIMDLVNKWK